MPHQHINTAVRGHETLETTRPTTPAAAPAAPAQTSDPIVIPSVGGGGRIRTYEDIRRQIYSLLPLTARQPLRRLCRPAQRKTRLDKISQRACQLRPVVTQFSGSGHALALLAS